MNGRHTVRDDYRYGRCRNAMRLYRLRILHGRHLCAFYGSISRGQYDVPRCAGLDVIAVLETHADTYDFPLRYFLGT